MDVISAIGFAIIEIKGKVVGLAFYQLLVGKSREIVIVCADLNGENFFELLIKLEVAINKIYQEIRLQFTLPIVESS